MFIRLLKTILLVFLNVPSPSTSTSELDDDDNDSVSSSGGGSRRVPRVGGGGGGNGSSGSRRVPGGVSNGSGSGNGHVQGGGAGAGNDNDPYIEPDHEIVYPPIGAEAPIVSYSYPLHSGDGPYLTLRKRIQATNRVIDRPDEACPLPAPWRQLQQLMASLMKAVGTGTNFAILCDKT